MAKFDLRPWSLTEEENFSTFVHWKSHLILCLSQKNQFESLVTEKWSKIKENKPNRNLTDVKDTKGTVTTPAKERGEQLDHMLKLVARYAPPYLRSDIVDSSTCLDDVWRIIRQYYNFQKSEINFISLLDIKREVDASGNPERPQRLLKRMLAHIEDNLLTADSELLFEGEKPTENEVMTPTHYRLATLMWLHKLHPGLPSLIKTKMAQDLQKVTLYDLSGEICRNLEHFLAELDSGVDISFARSRASFSGRPRGYDRRPPSTERYDRRPPSAERYPRHQQGRSQNVRFEEKICYLCRANGLPCRHSMGMCDQLPMSAKRDIANSLRSSEIRFTDSDMAGLSLDTEPREDFQYHDHDQSHYPGEPPNDINTVSVCGSPKIMGYFNDQSIVVTVDTGAGSSLINYETAKRLGVPIKPSRQTATQANGTRLCIVGETYFTIRVGSFKFYIDALVVESLSCQCLGGVPFQKRNLITVDMPNDRLIVNGKHVVKFLTKRDMETRAYCIKAQKDMILLPGDSMILHIPAELQADVALEPVAQLNPLWPRPDIVSPQNRQLSVENNTNDIISINRGQSIASVRSTFVPPDDYYPPSPSKLPPEPEVAKPNTIANAKVAVSEASSIQIDPNGQWKGDVKSKFEILHQSYSVVFDKSIGRYNDSKGRIRAHINLGSQPPKCKGAVPNYSPDKMSLMQQKMDELENQGVLARPEDLGIVVEQVSPSFLVPKSTPGEYRLVTSFNRLANYVKPPPSKSASTDDVMIFLSRWSHIIKTDMSNQFYQLPLEKDGMKYVGTVTPFKGIRIYTRAAMGMPGSSENLDELMTRIIGDLMHEGSVTKIADDIYVGGNSANELLDNWRRLLQLFKENNLRLSASKTVINPGKTVVLGWNWHQGQLTPSPHKISSLSTAPLPHTSTALRSWMGSVKQLKPCIEHYAKLFGGFDKLHAGKVPGEKITWTEEAKKDFYVAQASLRDLKSFHVPKPDDQLIVVTDGSIKNRGVGAVLYIQRGAKRLLGGYFSATLPEYQSRWLPCEIEGIAICTAVRHWSKVIQQSRNRVQVLTDSKPCVEAYNRLCKGQFSSRSRICSFLSTLADSRATVAHIPGKQNLVADYQSRQPAICDWENCQVCQFLQEESISVDSVTVSDILEGRQPAPFLSRNAWRESQTECEHLRRVYYYLKFGIRPNRKSREATDVKRYLQHSTLVNGLIVVHKVLPMGIPVDLIIVPEFMIKGLLTALHLKLNHPTIGQLKKVFDRHFFGLNVQDYITEVTHHCHVCAALRTIPNEVPEFSTTRPMDSPGVEFSADVIRRKSQFIFMLRDNFSSYTTAELIASEKHEDLRKAILRTVLPLRLSDHAVIRVDNASGLKALGKDPELQRNGIQLVFGDPRNVNKNPVGEKAVQELEKELVRLHPRGEKTTDITLAKAVKTLNSRVRSRGLSAQEILFRRTEFNPNHPLPSDKSLAEKQFENRTRNHEQSARCKVPVGPPRSEYHPIPGDLVFVKTDGDKHTGREPYMIISCFEDHVSARKLCGTQFRANLINLKRHQIYPVPNSARIERNFSLSDYDSSDDDDNRKCASTRKPHPEPEAKVEQRDQTEETNDTNDENNLERSDHDSEDTVTADEGSNEDVESVDQSIDSGDNLEFLDEQCCGGGNINNDESNPKFEDDTDDVVDSEHGNETSIQRKASSRGRILLPAKKDDNFQYY